VAGLHDDEIPIDTELVRALVGRTLLYISLVTFPYWTTMPARCTDRPPMAHAVLTTG